MCVRMYLCIIFLLSYLLVEETSAFTIDMTLLHQALGNGSVAQQMASVILEERWLDATHHTTVHLGQSEHSKTKK